MKKLLLVLIIFVSALQLRAQEASKDFIIYFNLDSYELSQAAKATLDSITLYTKELKDISISGAGYTDDSGTASYNKVLAANRLNAAKRYLEAQGLSIIAIDGSYNTTVKPTTPEKQRRAVISIKGKNLISAGAGYSPQEFTGPGGTVVIANVENGSNGAISINEYFSPESMIANGIYAIDVNGDILQTDGMIEICNDIKKLDPDGKTFTVKIPANRGKVNRRMSIWLLVRNENGTSGWQNTTIDITTDPEEKFYIFQVPIGTQGCIKINLDRPVCGTKDIVAGKNISRKPVAVYIETLDAFDFYAVCITPAANYSNEENALPFSAKLNDKLWLFTAEEEESVRNMNFFGKYRDDKDEKMVAKSLERVKYRYDEKDHSHYFFIKDRKPKTAEEKEKGFWAWVKRQFS